MPVITLLTDFGLRDYYVASMKAVILSICPSASIVDISHEVSSFDVYEAAFLLAASYGHFPRNTVHVAVVDPGVGTQRKPLVLKTRNFFFVGPDNGVLSLASELDGLVEAREISSQKLILRSPSSTFHGRDVFAPAAAHIACGMPVSQVGPEVREITKLTAALPSATGGVFECKVIHVDKFGNVVTNLPADRIPSASGRLTLSCSSGTYEIPLVRAYGEVPDGALLATIGSAGFLEVSVNKGSAASRLMINKGENVILEFRKV